MIEYSLTRLAADPRRSLQPAPLGTAPPWRQIGMIAVAVTATGALFALAF